MEQKEGIEFFKIRSKLKYAHICLGHIPYYFLGRRAQMMISSALEEVS